MIANGVDGDPPGYEPAASALLVTRPQLCVEHRSICEKMGHSMVVAANYMHGHPAESVAILKKKFATIDEKVLASAFHDEKFVKQEVAQMRAWLRSCTQSVGRDGEGGGGHRSESQRGERKRARAGQRMTPYDR